MKIHKNQSHRLITMIIAIAVISTVESYRILGVFPLPGKSHDTMLSALMKGLARRDHQVDVITHFPVKNPPNNYKVVVDLSGTAEILTNNFSIEFTKMLVGDPAYYISTTYGNDLCQLMNTERMRKFINNLPVDSSYDLVVTEAMGSSCYYGFGHLLNVPVVAVSTFAEASWISEYIGSADNPAIVSNTFFKGTFDRFSFWNRLQNTITYYTQVYEYQRLTDVQTELMRRYLGKPDVPSVRQLERNLSLLLVNRHPVIYGSKPITAAVIEVSGLHINESDSELTMELKKWLDDANYGVVYFTFGSMVLIETLDTETINAIYKSFAKLAPMRVLMKIANVNELPPGMPENVLTAPWMPQQNVLAHKNIRVFITHGGLMGCQETLYHGVPIIGIPLFADQMQNIARFEANNMGVKINHNNITEKSLDEALNEVLNNPKYRESAKFYSKLFRDRPMKAMDTAVFWIEYVIRNGGEILRSPAIEMSWWQLALIDVYGFLLFCIVSTLTLIYCFIKFFVKMVFLRSPKKLKKK